MAFYKAGKELADLHLNYEQGINIPATEQGAVAYSEMSAQAQRTLGVIVTGDIDIWQDEWTEETYHGNLAVDVVDDTLPWKRCALPKCVTKTESSSPTKHTSSTIATLPLRTFRSKPMSTSSMVSQPLNG